MTDVPDTDWMQVDRARNADRMITGLDRLRDDPFFAHSKARMATFLPSRGQHRLLDVGCGTGEDAVGAPAQERFVVGVERSERMNVEARRRHPSLSLALADAQALPFASAGIDAVIADRVFQHLADVSAALIEFRRVVRRGGVAVSFDPDLSTAKIDGVDQDLADRVLAWRTGTRPGAESVRRIDELLAGAGFDDVHVERHLLDVASPERADGMLGLAGWGEHAAQAKVVGADEARRWKTAVDAASVARSLRFRCEYVLAVGQVTR